MLRTSSKSSTTRSKHRASKRHQNGVKQSQPSSSLSTLRTQRPARMSSVHEEPTIKRQITTHRARSKPCNALTRRSFSSTATGSTKKHKNAGVDFEFALPPSPHPNYQVVIGLETHAQIKTDSKLFSGSSTAFSDPPNANTSLFDAATPGTLPRLNQECVKQVVKTGLALGGKVNLHTHFHRKQYFYSDMPSGYQITQNNPLVKGGSIALDSLLPQGMSRSVGIHHIQLEHDSGKSLHDVNPYQSHIDLNRSGVALMEVVTTPTIYSAHEAVLYLKKLQSLFRHLGTSNANLEEGSMRCDVNVTVRRITPPGPMTERVEIKNMNSFKHMLYAIQSEAARQIQILEGNPIDMNDAVIERETRGYDPKKDSTYRLRSKENLLDYRFLPEPDLPPLVLNRSYIQSIAEREIPILPDEMYSYLHSVIGLSQKESNVILGEDGAFTYLMDMLTLRTNIPSSPSAFQPTTAPKLTKRRPQEQLSEPQQTAQDDTQGEVIHILRDPKQCYNWMVNDLFGKIKKNREANPVGSTKRYLPLLEECSVTPYQLSQICDMVQNSIISGKQGKAIVDELFAPRQLDQSSDTDNDDELLASPTQTTTMLFDLYNYAKQQGMIMDSDPIRIQKLIDIVVSTYPDEVSKYVHDNRKQYLGFLSGQVIKLSKQQQGLGEANPREVSRILQDHLTTQVH